nr:RNA-directed DNA polymerase, eukaryota, reverse transcriptase zinc-binding domain protein [Tanacetum cinerariifolium]
MDDLYNNLKIYEAEVIGSSSTTQNTQNVGFVSFNNTDSTNKAVNTTHGVSAASSKTNASNLPNVDILSDAVIYSFFTSQSNSPQLDNEDLKQIDLHDLEEMDLKWQMAMLTMRARRFLQKTRRSLCVKRTGTIGFNKTKVEYYNFHRRGHFVRECRAFKHQDNMNKKAPIRTVPVEDTTLNALISQCDGLGYDWSDQAEDGPTNFALMAYTSSSSSISYTEVSTYSKACLKSYETLKEQYDNLTKDFNKPHFNLGAYKASLESVEARLEVCKKDEVVFEDDIKILKHDVIFRDKAIPELRQKFEKVKKERDDSKLTLEKFKGEGYHAVPPPYTGNFMPPKPDLVFADEHVVSESVTSLPSIVKSKVKTSESKLKTVSEPVIEDWDRIVWIYVEGIPLRAWSKTTFNKIARKWGELVFMDDSNSANKYSLRICVKTKFFHLIVESLKVIIKGKVYVVRAKEVTSWVLDFGEENSDESEDYSDNNSETKMVSLDVFVVKNLWGNMLFDFATSSARSRSGGTLCVWDKLLFHKKRTCATEHCLCVEGTWMANNVDLLFISVYSAHELSLKRVLWNYMLETLNRWHGEVIIMGDFNEVFFASERHGSYFHSLNVAKFNMFIANSQLIDIPLGGLILHRHLSDHRPILLKETHVDYGPTPFHLYHSWFLEDDFHSVIEDSWNNDGISASNSMILLKNKLKFLKQRLKEWSSIKRRNKDHDRKVIQDSLIEIDHRLDKGNGLLDDMTKRANLFLFDLEDMVSNEEIKRAVWDCGSDKSPGPDGFTFEFEEILDYYAKHLKDSSPISLIGCQYKIIGKILANRLRLVIGDIVSQEQLAFIKGRKIMDGPLILNEVISWYKARKEQLLMFKVDFQKAFDSVRWDHLDDILGKYGFGIKWRGWIRGCLQSSKALVLSLGTVALPDFGMTYGYGDIYFKEKFKRLFNLEHQKDANVASKLQASNVASSFRRPPRSSFENSQFIELG